MRNIRYEHMNVGYFVFLIGMALPLIVLNVYTEANGVIDSNLYNKRSKFGGMII